MEIRNYKTLCEAVERRDGTAFPAASFADLVLRPAYEQAKRNLLPSMRALNIAHLLMLEEQKLVSHDDASNVMSAVLGLDYDALSQSTYSGEFEDLFFEVEAAIIRKSGEIGGNLHLARSRNDMCVAMYRIVLRERLLTLMEALYGAQEAVRAFAQEHRDTLMVAHTHTQQAQPSVLGHYFLGAFDVLDRDMARLRAAFITVNRSPMGAAAITTSGFAVDRVRVASLLGFGEVIENSYDAIGGGDYLGESAAAIAIAAVNLGRVVSDLLLWATGEFGVLRVAPAYIQISSIMPQKRNPVSIEHMRSILSTVTGCADTILKMLHNTPYGDIVDTEDDAQPYLWRATDTLSEVYRLFTAVIATMEVNRDVLAQRAKSSLCVVTELADTLARQTALPFRTAHSIVSAMVSHCLTRGLDITGMDEPLLRQIYLEKTGQPYAESWATLKKSLSPEHFVAIRTVDGGVAPEQVDKMVASARQKLTRNGQWLDEITAHLNTAQDERERLAKGMIL